MMKTRPVAVTAAGMLGLGMLGIAPAGAQTTLGINPSSGPPETSFEVTGGDPCLPDDPDADPAPEMTVEVSLDADLTPSATVSPDPTTGDWSATLTVAPDEPAGTYNVGARCRADGAPTDSPDVGNGSFTVEEEGEEPPEETTTTTEEETPGGGGPGDGDELPGPGDGSDDGSDDVGPDADDEDSGEDDADDEDADDEDAPAPAEPAPPINGDADYTG